MDLITLSVGLAYGGFVLSQMALDHYNRKRKTSAGNGIATGLHKKAQIGNGTASHAPSKTPKINGALNLLGAGKKSLGKKISGRKKSKADLIREHIEKGENSLGWDDPFPL